jgi:hypothetical protein
LRAYDLFITGFRGDPSRIPNTSRGVCIANKQNAEAAGIDPAASAQHEQVSD